MKRSVADLKERLTGWIDADHAAYELGACLGFWSDFGAPPGEDPWNGVEDIIKARHISLGWVLDLFLRHLTQAKVLETRTDPVVAYRWNPNYEIGQKEELECSKCRGRCRPWNHAGGYWDPNKDGHG